MTRSFGISVGFRLTVAFALGLLLAPLVAVAVPDGNARWPRYAGYTWWGEHPSLTMERLVFHESLQVAVVPAALALAVAKVASDFDHDMIAARGAVGVMQLLPATAAREFGVTAVELRDPITNARLGLHYLSRLYWRYDGDWELALSHYHGGALRWHAGRYWAHDHTRTFVDRVLRWWWLYDRDPALRAPALRARPMPRFTERFGIPELPGFTYEPPTRYRWPGSWIPITGDRFR